MPLIKDEGFILDRFPFKARHLGVVWFGKGYGKKRGIWRGSRTRLGGKSALVEILNRVEVLYWESSKAEMVSIREVFLVKSAWRLWAHHPNPSLSFAIAELFNRFTQENAPDERVFRLLQNLWEGLQQPIPGQRLFWYGETWLLWLHGVLPKALICPQCRKDARWFHRSTLSFSCETHKKPQAHPLSSQTLDIAKKYRTHALRDLEALPLQPGEETWGRLVGIFRHHYLQEDLKSLPMLKDYDTLKGL